ncbi:MAG: hypothetical protein ACUVV3_03530 [Dehalococcoidia bacterium]
MPGYQLVQMSQLKPYKTNGVEPLPSQMGVLDFLREVAAEEFALPRFFEVQLLGLEEVLFAAGENLPELAGYIRGRLRAAAADLERRLISVQVVFKGKLMRGDTLWCEYRSRRLPINLIFGSPIAQENGRGNRFYLTNFNLTDA